MTQDGRVRAVGVVSPITMSGLPVSAQTLWIEAEVARRGWGLVTIIEESEVTLELRRMFGGSACDRLRSYSFDALVMTGLDALTRTLSDLATFLMLWTTNRWTLVMLDADGVCAGLTAR